jgi:cold shock CspA family protein
VFFHVSVFDSGKDGPPPIMGEAVEFDLNDDGGKAGRVSRLTLPTHLSGTVTSYDPVKGYGFVRTSIGQCYIHKSEILGGGVPTVGSMVDFYVAEITLGKSPRACYAAVIQ